MAICCDLNINGCIPYHNVFSQNQWHSLLQELAQQVLVKSTESPSDSSLHQHPHCLQLHKYNPTYNLIGDWDIVVRWDQLLVYPFLEFHFNFPISNHRGEKMSFMKFYPLVANMAMSLNMYHALNSQINMLVLLLY